MAAPAPASSLVDCMKELFSRDVSEWWWKPIKASWDQESPLPKSQNWPEPARAGLSWPEPSLSYRYEDEINKRTSLENEFVVLKKVRGG